MLLIVVVVLVSTVLALIVAWVSRRDDSYELLTKTRYLFLGVALGAAGAFGSGRNPFWLISAIIIGNIVFRLLSYYVWRKLQQEFGRAYEEAKAREARRS